MRNFKFSTRWNITQGDLLESNVTFVSVISYLSCAHGSQSAQGFDWIKFVIHIVGVARCQNKNLDKYVTISILAPFHSFWCPHNATWCSLWKLVSPQKNIFSKIDELMFESMSNENQKYVNGFWLLLLLFSNLRGGALWTCGHPSIHWPLPNRLLILLWTCHHMYRFCL